MADAPAPTAPVVEPTPESDAPDEQLGDKGEKALEAWKQRAKTAEVEAKKAKALEAKLAAIEDRDKTEAQKLAERTAAAEKDAADARTELLRLKVGAAKGLAPELAERLRGATEAEMAADADSLLAVMKPKTPTGSFDAGPRGQQSPAGGDMNRQIRQAAGRQ